VAEQQLVEIARALSLKSRLIIMDEPTSALTETEVQRLLSIMAKLRADGEALHKAGKHQESVDTLGKAKGILGLK